MDRFWFLTWTLYGNWLPGDERGSVTTIREGLGPRHRQNLADQPEPVLALGLKRSAAELLAGEPIRLDRDQADCVVSQFRETAEYRGWRILAAAVMANHVHLVVGVPGDPEPDVLLRDLKSYASRALNRRWGKPGSGTWWTESGSKRKLATEEAVRAKIEYVRNQEYPLVIWIDEGGTELGQRPA